jgi:hypothetical protein
MSEDQIIEQILSYSGPNAFMVSLKQQYQVKGELTEKQLAGAKKVLESLIEKKSEAKPSSVKKPTSQNPLAEKKPISNIQDPFQKILKEMKTEFITALELQKKENQMMVENLFASWTAALTTAITESNEPIVTAIKEHTKSINAVILALAKRQAEPKIEIKPELKLEGK